MNTIKTNKKIIAYGPGNITGAMSLKDLDSYLNYQKINNHIINLINNGMC